ncbi:MAG: hypothetical protein ACREE2_05845 [Stellaceae bacterium]
MKQSAVIGLSLLALSACAYSDAWVGATPGVTRVGGSASNTTTTFDGTYTGIAIGNNSKGNTLATTGGTATLKCQNYDRPPTLTITNGFAQFQALGTTFAGYVTPQGQLNMRSGYGAGVAGQIKPEPVDEDFDGQIDARAHVLKGQVVGACAYNVSWQKIG